MGHEPVILAGSWISFRATSSAGSFTGVHLAFIREAKHGHDLGVLTLVVTGALGTLERSLRVILLLFTYRRAHENLAEL
jgi:hypothetical protein